MTPGSEAHTERKRILLARAAQERIELASDVDDLRAATQLPALMKALVPALVAKKWLPMVFGLLARHPILGSVLSFLASRFRRKPAYKPDKPGKVGKAAKLVGLLVLLWKGWRAVKGFRAISAAAKPPRRGFLSKVIAARR